MPGMPIAPAGIFFFGASSSPPSSVGEVGGEEAEEVEEEEEGASVGSSRRLENLNSSLFNVFCRERGGKEGRRLVKKIYNCLFL